MKNTLIPLLVIQSNQVLVFAAALLIAGIIGVLFVVLIIKQLPFYQGGMYAQPIAQVPTVVPTERSSSGKSGNGIGLMSLLLLAVSALFWMMVPSSPSGTNDSLSFGDIPGPTTSTPKQDTRRTPSEYQHPQKETITDSILLKDRSRVNQRPQKEGYSQLEVFQERSYKPPDRINKRPSDAKFVEMYVIQLMASDSYSSAYRMAEKLQPTHNMMVINDLDDNLYKVMVAPFKTKEDAKDYQSVHELKGYAKLISFNTEDIE